MYQEEDEEFKSVKSYDPVWNPIKAEDGTKRTVATESDFIDGYYIGYKDNQGPKKNSMVHTIQKKDGGRHSVWGTRILNDLLLEKVTPGQYIRIIWLGKIKPKGAGDDYHTWDVQVSGKTSVLDSSSLNKSISESAPANFAPTSSEKTQLGSERKYEKLPADNLPF